MMKRRERERRKEAPTTPGRERCLIATSVSQYLFFYNIKKTAPAKFIVVL